MHFVEPMISASPQRPERDQAALAACVKACLACEAACVGCADACLGEPHVDALRRCIRLDLDCADLCGAVGRVVMRLREPDGPLLRAALEACVAACDTCAAECERHAEMHDHCRVCAEACRACQKACQELLGTFERKIAAK